MKLFNCSVSFYFSSQLRPRLVTAPTAEAAERYVQNRVLHELRETDPDPSAINVKAYECDPARGQVLLDRLAESNAIAIEDQNLM